MIARLALAGLVLVGSWGSGRLSWRQWSVGEACPVVGSVPACYVAFAGYIGMVAGLALVGQVAWARSLFYTGLAAAGGLALIGSGMELLRGDVCPRVGAVPTCYVSLGLSVLIGVLFWQVNGLADRG